MTPVKFENIQALRGVAVLLVVFCHLQVIEQKYSHGQMVLPDWLDYAIASVDLFRDQWFCHCYGYAGSISVFTRSGALHFSASNPHLPSLLVLQRHSPDHLVV